MIPHWHPEMDVIVDAAEHRRREQAERRATLDEIAARQEVREITVEFLDGQIRLLPRRPAAPAVPDPVAEIRAALAGYDRWRASDELSVLAASVPRRPAGTCLDCGLASAAGNSRCSYCAELAAYLPPPAPPAPRSRIPASSRSRALVLFLGIALLYTAAYVFPPLMLPAIACIVLALAGWKR